MSEHPIIFSAPMVRAIFAATKTQTRRIVKPQPTRQTEAGGVAWDGPDNGLGGMYNRLVLDNSEGLGGVLERCPYGVPGDRLWVRETFTLENCQEVGWYEPPHTDGRPLRTHQHPDDGTWWEQPHYLATDPAPELVVDNDSGEPGCKWTPSIFMPRWASRLTLELTEVRVQRLQEISEEDARAEGMQFHDGLGIGHSGWRHDLNYGSVEGTAREAFAVAWDLINGKRAPWASNPWAWCLSFRRVEAGW